MPAFQLTCIDHSDLVDHIQKLVPINQTVRYCPYAEILEFLSDCLFHDWVRVTIEP